MISSMSDCFTADLKASILNSFSYVPIGQIRVKRPPESEGLMFDNASMSLIDV